MPLSDPNMGPVSLTQEGAVRLCLDMPIGVAAIDKDGKFQMAEAYLLEATLTADYQGKTYKASPGVIALLKK